MRADDVPTVHDLHRLRGEGFTHPRETLPEVRELLRAAEFPEERREAVRHCVARHEEYDFAEATDLEHDPTPEERVLRDADNLDALGAVGIGRAFTFGAHHGQGMYDPERADRAGFVEAFVERFEAEWRGER